MAEIAPVEVDVDVTVRGARERTYPVIEIFGPTIQGEGPDAGLTCSFIRVGGCDYRCSWCDSMYAVDPAEVKAHAEKLTAAEIVDRLPVAPMVVISGGNPALLELGPLVARIQDAGMRVSVETQGSRWKPWLAMVDQLVVSPKPPSSDMVSEEHEAETAGFFAALARQDGATAAIKIVVGSATDYGWAKRFIGLGWPVYLSALTPQPSWSFEPSNEQIEDAEQSAIRMLRDNYAWLCNTVAQDPEMADVRVLPQLHVVAWGLARGV